MKLAFKNTEAIILVGAVLLVLVILLVPGKPDVNFARSVFKKLVYGMPAAQDMLDWENLEMMGEDVGVNYRKLPNDSEKSNYRQEFIKNFSMSFKTLKVSANVFTNWRLYGIKEGKVVVEVIDSRSNYPLYFTVVKSIRGKRLLRKVVPFEPDED